VSQWIYQLDAVRPLPATDGSMREATHDDLELLVDWWGAFVEEAAPHDERSRDAHRRAVEHKLETSTGGVALWEDGGATVSLAAYGSPTPNGIRIGPVYTPRARRGHGYATALTAQISQQLLDRGRRFCFLYTDATNATSNAIYERIGYRKVCGSAMLAFT
jgi:predicted GNAT family acetyltransferase